MFPENRIRALEERVRILESNFEMVDQNQTYLRKMISVIKEKVGILFNGGEK
tara:strand:+ start:35 stop:190 length:156 start_codon:yes stop_codon:yes gene_type:complete